MNNIELKKGDVIAINWDGTKMLAIFEKFDTTFGNQDGLYIYRNEYVFQRIVFQTR